MFDDGYEKITNIDISQTSIKAMAEKYKEKGENFKFVQMDVRAMDFPENSFDAVIDKATFDSVVVTSHLCSAGRVLIPMPTRCSPRSIECSPKAASIL